ncbi:hypothetical protein FLA_3197 [Filimonas lacunae]|nr:hypothetical protein FLA_3197 [Filimonas lacunae]
MKERMVTEQNEQICSVGNQKICVTRGEQRGLLKGGSFFLC